MALAAAIPPQWPPEWVYAGIVVVLAFINWTGLSREVRGLVLSLKERDYVHAAEASGASTARTVRKHLIPNMASHIIVTATLAVPVTILGESALSFLGIGVRPPMVSWGLLLNDAIKIQNIVLYPWTFISGRIHFGRGHRLQLPGRWVARHGRSVFALALKARRPSEGEYGLRRARDKDRTSAWTPFWK